MIRQPDIGKTEGSLICLTAGNLVRDFLDHHRNREKSESAVVQNAKKRLGKRIAL